jgi:hypothetical protein
MSILATLSESTQFSTQKSLHDLDSHDISIRLYLHILALRILLEEDEKDATIYAHDIIKHSSFKRFYGSAPDIYHLIYALDRAGGRGARRFPELTFERWLKHPHSDQGELLAYQFTLNLDTHIAGADSSMRAIRRIVQSWSTVGDTAKKLAATRLLQLLHTHCRKSDLYLPLQHFSKREHLIITDKLDEDADGGGDSTTSGNIATTVMPLGALQRRKP